MTTTARISNMGAIEQALLLSLISWKSRNERHTDAMVMFARVIRYVERGASRSALHIMYHSATANWPEQLKRIMHPYVFGDASQKDVLDELRTRVCMIESWPPEWFH